MDADDDPADRSFFISRRPDPALKRRRDTECNSGLPEKIPGGGLIILRDGDPGEPEQVLGGFGSTYYQHAVEVYFQEGDAAA